MSLESLLSNPSVLRSAWQKVYTWYQATELRPEPDYSHWILNWEEELQKLGEELVANTYAPLAFPLVPYPKKGATIRHYTMPSVRDQVAFAVFAVLLAPICELRMPNLSFGNRWYRGVYRKAKDDNQGEFEWAKRAFSLSDKNFYEPYRRSHGLFRRLAHWTAASLLATDINSSSFDEMLSPDDYPADSLPPFVKDSWWQGNSSDKHLGYWVQGDLQLAYPSVCIQELVVRLKELANLEFGATDSRPIHADDYFGMKRDVAYATQALAGFSSVVAHELIHSQSVRDELAERLGSILKQVAYSKEADAWLPPHTKQHLPLSGGDHIGLPTGLAVSGFLMNVYLTKLDTGMCEWITQEKLADGKENAAYLRFADDFIILGSSKDCIARAIDVFWRNLAGSSLAVLSAPESDNRTNLRINWAKTKPDSWADCIDTYLKEKGWQNCNDCGLLESRTPVDSESFSSWFRKTQVDDTVHGAMLKSIERDALTPSKLGPFVTYLVERLSEIGNDSLLNRFGQLSFDRLRELHSLVRSTLGDGQIRDDTRLSFAVNRLADTWLPDESPTGGSYLIREIRRSATECLSRAPWKFQMWRSIIRCAVRRAPSLDSTTERWAEEELEATTWLTEMLSFISLNEKHHDSWRNNWPEEITNLRCRKNDDWKSGYLSFLRASFWSALADVLVDLTKMADAIDSLKGPDKRAFARWNSKSWIFRILSEEQVRPVLEWLSQLDEWASVIYGESGLHHYEISEIELVAIKKTILATVSRSKLVADLKTSKQFSFQLSAAGGASIYLPMASFENALPRLSGLVRQAESSSLSDWQPHMPKTSAWPLLLLATDDANSGRVIGKLLDSLSKMGTSVIFRFARIFGASQKLTKTVSVKRIDTSAQAVKAGSNAFLLPRGQTLTERMTSLRSYAEIRSTSNAQKTNTLSETQAPGQSLHALLWSELLEGTSFAECSAQPWLAPAVGLPVSVAMAMFKDILLGIQNSIDSPIVESNQNFPLPPTWKVVTADVEKLVAGRRQQIGIGNLKTMSDSAQSFAVPIVKEGNLQTDWDILPHPAYYLPWALGLVNGPSQKYQLWCHFLTFLTALEGSEHILESFWLNGGPGAIKFEERWDMRSRIHLPTELWRELSKLQVWFSYDLDWSRPPATRLGAGQLEVSELTELLPNLLKALEGLAEYPVGQEDFEWQRIDISLLATSSNDELPRSVRRWNLSGQRSEFELNKDLLANNLNVRIAQISASPEWNFLAQGQNRYFRNFPYLTRMEVQGIMEQVCAAFLVQSSRHQKRGDSCANESSETSELIVFPELILPPAEIDTVVNMAYKTRKSALIGMQLRILPNALGGSMSPSGSALRVVNEALLAVPVYFGAGTTHPLVRKFLIEKPIPSHIELGLMSALSSVRNKSNTQYLFKPGRTWYRFIHPQWGDFSVAICADIIDPRPWASMRSELLHIFMCACNTDVELFDSMTWVRAYENYINVVSTNHGMHGGSFAWTPKHNGSRELAKLRGKNIFLLADIVLPVVELLAMQKNGVRQAESRQESNWLGTGQRSKSSFKSPPPGYRER